MLKYIIVCVFNQSDAAVGGCYIRTHTYSNMNNNLPIQLPPHFCILGAYILILFKHVISRV